MLGQLANHKMTRDSSLRVSQSSHLTILLWRWSQLIPPKLRCIITRLHAVTTPENSMLRGHRWCIYKLIFLPPPRVWLLFLHRKPARADICRDFYDGEANDQRDPLSVSVRVYRFVATIVDTTLSQVWDFRSADCEGLYLLECHIVTSGRN